MLGSINAITDSGFYMIGFCPLASGSKGNAIYLGTPDTKILIDCGLSGRALKAKLAEISVSVEELDALLITHEHGDHVKALPVFALRHGVPVLANSPTAKAIVDQLGRCPTFKIFSTGESFTFKDLHIHPFSIPHDTAEPVAFTIQYKDLKLGFCTDLGFVTTLTTSKLMDCDYLYLEANHEPEMVHACPRPQSYKQRVLGRNGHLSNAACGELLNEIWSPKLKHVHLAHLSEECNAPEKALQVVRSALRPEAQDLPISIAFQHERGKEILFEQASAVEASTVK